MPAHFALRSLLTILDEFFLPAFMSPLSFPLLCCRSASAHILSFLGGACLFLNIYLVVLCPQFSDKFKKSLIL